MKKKNILFIFVIFVSLLAMPVRANAASSTNGTNGRFYYSYNKTTSVTAVKVAFTGIRLYNNSDQNRTGQLCASGSGFSRICRSKTVPAKQSVTLPDINITIYKSTASRTVTISLTTSGGFGSSSIRVTVPGLQSWSINYHAPLGATNVPASQKKYYGRTSTLSSQIPILVNNRFTKWNTKEDGSGTNYNPGASYSINSALNLYAQWEPTIIEYDGNKIPQDSYGRYVFKNALKDNYKKKFGIKVYNDEFDTDVVLQTDQCEEIVISPGTYNIKEILGQEYEFDSVTGINENNGSVVIEEDKKSEVKFTNKFNKKDYLHSYGRVENKIKGE